METNRLKILVIGDGATGKTSLIYRYFYKRFGEVAPTISLDFQFKKLRIEDSIWGVQLWDIAGQHRFNECAPMFYRGALGAIIVFDVTNKKSLDNVINWKKSIENYASNSGSDSMPIVLFGNKYDLIDSNAENSNNDNNSECINDNYVIEFCETNNIDDFFYTSAKTGYNIKKGINTLLNRVVQNIKLSELWDNNNKSNKNKTNSHYIYHDNNRKFSLDSNIYDNSSKQKIKNSCCAMSSSSFHP